MKRNVAGAVVVLILGFACSACGGFLLSGVPSGSSGHVSTIMSTISASLPPAVQRLPLSRSGTGSQSLGTFAVHGNIRVRATCVGAGTFLVEFVQSNGETGMGGVHCQGDNALALNTASNLGMRGGGPAQITVRAPAHMKWWLDVVDRQPRF